MILALVGTGVCRRWRKYVRMPSSVPAVPTTRIQVNNVFTFPFIFRGALDVGAAAINEEMKLAWYGAFARLAMEQVSGGWRMAIQDPQTLVGISHSKTVAIALDR